MMLPWYQYSSNRDKYGSVGERENCLTQKVSVVMQNSKVWESISLPPFVKVKILFSLFGMLQWNHACINIYLSSPFIYTKQASAHCLVHSGIFVSQPEFMLGFLSGRHFTAREKTTDPTQPELLYHLNYPDCFVSFLCMMYLPLSSWRHNSCSVFPAKPESRSNHAHKPGTKPS